MQVSPNVPRLLRCVMPSLLATSAACATATYDPPTGADSGGSTSASGGEPGLGSAGAAPIAGAFDMAGSTSTAAGSTSSAGGFGGSFGSAGTMASAGSAGAMASAGSAAGGASHAGSGGGAGASSGACNAPAWVPNVAYRMGDKATKNGKEYTAAWYTMADPESHCCGNGQDWASSVTCP